MTAPCTLCRQELENVFAHTCARCGASQGPDRDEEDRRLLLMASIKTGIREATRRNAVCGHSCPTTSLGVDIPGGVKYVTLMSRCVYEWFATEYPPTGEITHDAFHYPA